MGYRSKLNQQAKRGNVPDMAKLRAAAGKQPPVTDPVAHVSALEMREVAEAVDPFPRFVRERAIPHHLVAAPTWRTWLLSPLHHARVWFAVLFRRRVP